MVWMPREEAVAKLYESTLPPFASELARILEEHDGCLRLDRKAGSWPRGQTAVLGDDQLALASDPKLVVHPVRADQFQCSTGAGLVAAPL